MKNLLPEAPIHKRSFDLKTVAFTITFIFVALGMLYGIGQGLKAYAYYTKAKEIQEIEDNIQKQKEQYSAFENDRNEALKQAEIFQKELEERKATAEALFIKMDKASHEADLLRLKKARLENNPAPKPNTSDAVGVPNTPKKTPEVD